MLGSNQSGMRDRNERLVLTMLRNQGPHPKSEIARRTGLSAQTVSVIMRALEQDGLLLKGQKTKGKIGQPSIPIKLNPEGAFFYGLKVGRRSCELVLVDFVGKIRFRERIVYPYPKPSQTTEFVQAAIARIEQKLSTNEKDRIAGLGIATPFFLWEWAEAIGVDSDDMAAWKGFDLQAEIQAFTSVPIYLGNDATCACGSELVFGTTEKPKDFLYFYFAYFIGGGLVLDGKLFEGSSRNAGALGPFPTPLHKGNGSAQLMDVASLRGLEQRLIDKGQSSERMWKNPDLWDVEEETVDDWIKQVSPAVAFSILSAVAILDFPAIVIDGAMPQQVRDKLVDQIQSELRKLNFSGLIMPEILAGSCGNDARSLGAASLPLSSRFMMIT